MTVSELINKLQKYPQGTQVKVWDPYYDRETSEVFINQLDKEIILITNSDWNKE